MDLLGTDMTRVAAAYAAFAGVLAGFVFAVMGYLLGNRSNVEGKRNRNIESSLSWSVLAFIGLSIAAFLFALLSGDDRFGLPINPATGVGPTRIRPLALDVVASAGLSVATLVLLLSLNWLFHNEHISLWFGIQLRVAMWLVGLLTLFYVDGAFLAVPVAQGQLAVDDVGPVGLLAAIWLAVVVIGEVAGLLLRLKGDAKNSGQNLAVRVISQFLLLLLFFAGAVIFNLIEFANEKGSSAWDVLGYQWWGIGLMGFAIFLSILNLPNWMNEDKESLLE